MRLLPSSLDPCFLQRKLATLIQEQRYRAEIEIDSISDDELLIFPLEDIVDRVYEAFHVPPLIIDRHGIAHTPRAINRHVVNGMIINVDAFVFEVEFPYTGASGLLNHTPETYDLDPPRAKLNQGGYQGSIIISVAGEDLTQEVVKNEIDKELAKFDKYIANQSIQLTPFNSSFRDFIRGVVETRKAKILQARNIASSLGYPMHRRTDAPLTYVSPAIRKRIPVRVLPTERFTPEPTLDENAYQDILTIIEKMTFVMERSPTVFSKMPEELLRDHYLVQLNGQYDSATGETFNAQGKTDILVRDKGSNIFIAECKIWRGQQSATEAIDQLLSYMTWRDTKAALIVFSRNKEFSKVLKTLWPTIAAHHSYKRGPTDEGETRKKFVFGKPGDPTREIFVTVLAFNMPDE